jgi:hypothetical protein
MDQLVDGTCGSNPLERKLNARLERSKLDDKALTAAKKCVDGAINAKVDAPLPWKALGKLDAQAEAALRGCLQRQNVYDTRIVELLVGYVRDAFAGNAQDRRMLDDYARCYGNVLRCRANPCPATAAARPPRPPAAALTLSVRLLSARPGETRFAPLPASTPLRSGDGLVFQVTTSRRAFVYIVQKPAAPARLRVLFPDRLIPTRNPIEAGPLRLPPTEHFLLDDEVGPETILVVASEREQVDLSERLSGYQAKESDDGARSVGQALGKLAGKGAPAREGQDAVSRGLILAARRPGAANPAPSSLGPVFTAQALPGDDTVVVQVGFTHLAADAP